MLIQEESLAYCAYAIAIFDLLCAVLFAVLSIGLICTHLSWLTIFCCCFGVFWITLILMLISGIYRRDSDMVRYWLMFSSFGILVELLLIVFAFVSNSTFQAGIMRNCFVLCLGLLVEAIFAFIIYQFYQEVSKCDTRQRKLSSAECVCTPQRSKSQLQQRSRPQQVPCDCGKYRSSSQRSRLDYRCNILQSRASTSPYTCGPISSRSSFKR